MRQTIKPLVFDWETNSVLTWEQYVNINNQDVINMLKIIGCTKKLKSNNDSNTFSYGLSKICNFQDDLDIGIKEKMYKEKRQ